MKILHHQEMRKWPEGVVAFRTAAGYKSPQILKSFLPVTQDNVAQRRCPTARQGPIHSPTRSKLQPKCSYNSSEALWCASRSMLLLVGFLKNKQAREPHHRVLTVIVGWVYPMDDVRAVRPWHRGLCGVSPLGLPRVWCVPLNCHWKGQEGSLTTFNPNVLIRVAPAPYCERGVLFSRY